ncbi:BNR/Asp-box repeat protein [Georgenia soli]|uniref:BNR/Asp-box repeat protein n=1 Tax=Georgenia soli TaxID=638953 RepID=A0A2A9F370_9MICO|nr:BNR/Asp-box repeat protein [Georgenia soli]
MLADRHHARRTAAAAAANDPGTAFGHVHGLGVNPAEDTVYVATHHGLYSLDGAGERVGTSRADLMGFTVVGEDTFLASGHPAPDEAGPSNLGLIRSTDAGQTWEEVSLGGQSDFHGLTATGDRVYGLDSGTGTVMRSDDGGETWQQGASLPARDLDVDPADPDRVVATTAEGLVVSTDGGVTFAPAELQPPRPLVVVDHLPADEGGPTPLVGLDTAGVLWRFPGAAWSSAGPENGEPHAFTAVDEDTYLAAFGTDIARTDDGGSTWLVVSGSAR